MLVVGDITHQLFTAAPRGPQVLWFPRHVVGNYGVSSVKDRLGGPVILVQDDDGRVGERPLELEEVPHIGSPPTVDRLVGIADHRYLVMSSGKLQHELVLCPVGVLVLVDQDVLEALLVCGQDVGVVPEQPDGDPQQVVEVHRVRRHQPALVLLVYLCDLAFEQRAAACALRVFGRTEQLVFCTGDRGVDGAGRELLSVQAQIPDHVAGEADGIGLVIDRKRLLVTERSGFPAQYPHARRVERRHPHALRHRADEAGDTVAHLVGRLVGKSDRQYRERREPFFADQPGNAVRKDARLA